MVFGRFLVYHLDVFIGMNGYIESEKSPSMIIAIALSVAILAEVVWYFW